MNQNHRAKLQLSTLTFIERLAFVFATALAFTAFCACTPYEEQRQVLRVPPSSTERFSVRVEGSFNDSLAYNGVRAIYVITNKNTGIEYVGVSGVGISELGIKPMAGTEER